MAGLFAEGQPFNVFFRLDVGALQKIWINPNVPMSLDVTMKPGFYTFTAQLFDPTGFEVEPAFWTAIASSESGLPQGIVQWGYTNFINLKSSEYNCIITRYFPTLGKNYFTLRLEGTITFVDSPLNTAALAGTLEEVIGLYASRYNTTIDADLNFSNIYLIEVGNTGDTTDFRKTRFHKEHAESDFQFLMRIVKRYALSTDGVGKYYVYHTTVNGEDSLIIRNPEQAPEADADYVWVVQHPDSVVIDWSPEIDFVPHVGILGDALVAKTYQSITGEELAVSCNVECTKNNVHTPIIGEVAYDHKYIPVNGLEETKELQIGMENMTDPVKYGGSRGSVLASFEGRTAVVNAVNAYLEGLKTKIRGILTIQGDPRIVPGRKCLINYFYPTGYSGVRKLHYSSGLYYIESVTHNIRPGSYTTQLQVWRTGTPSSPF